MTLKILLILILSPIYWLWAQSHIAIYKDEGITDFTLQHVSHALQQLDENFKISSVNADQIKNGFLETEAVDLLVIPGGADRFYAKKLDGPGNQKIREFIKNGGSYLGLCAGGYYGTRRVVFDKGGKLEVIGDRELAFFKGQSIGPLHPYQYGKFTGARAKTLMIKNHETIDAYYNGGCYFKPDPDFKDFETLATYQSGKIAIVKMNFGRGRVALSGVHFEYDPEYFGQNAAPDKNLNNILKTLKQKNDQRKAFFRELVEYLLRKTKP